MLEMVNARSNIRTYSDRTRVQLKEIAAGADISYEALRLFLNGGDVKLSTFLRICATMNYAPNTMLRTRL